METEQKRQESRDRFHRSISVQNSQFEKKRTEKSEAKKHEAYLARKERNLDYQKGFNNKLAKKPDLSLQKIELFYQKIAK